jgi:hypothetical protein
MFALIGGLVAAGIFAAAGMLYTHDDKRLAVWTFFVGAVLTLFIACKMWADLVTVDKQKQSHSLPNELDKANSKPLPTPAQSASPSPVTQLPFTIPSPITVPTEPAHKDTLTATPTPTPEIVVTQSSTALATPTLENIAGRVWDSELDNSRKEQIRKALVGVDVDWTLFFFSAWQSDVSPRRMHVTLWLGDDYTSKTFRIAFARFSLPLRGNQRLPLLEKTNRVRVQGKIESVSLLCDVELKDAVIELK